MSVLNFYLKTQLAPTIIIFLLLLSACSVQSTAEPASSEPAVSAPTSSGQPADMEIDNSETEIGIVIQEYEGENIAEVLMVQYDGQQKAFEQYNWRNPEIEKLNNIIMAEPLRMFQDFQGENSSAIEIRSYPFMDENLVQIVTSCVVYPQTDPAADSKLWSYCFSKAENRIIDLDEMLKEYSLTRREISAVFSDLYKPERDNERIVEVEVTGFLIANLPSRPVTNFLLEVMLEMESDPYKSFFIYMPEYDEVKELNGFRLFDPDVWDMVEMDPPLVYAREEDGSE